MRISVLAVSLLSLCGPGAAFGQTSTSGIITTRPSVSCSDIHSAPDCSVRQGASGGLGSARTAPLYRTSPTAIGSTVNTSTTGTRSTSGALVPASGGIGTLRPSLSTLGVSGRIGTLPTTISAPRAVGPLGTISGTPDGSSVSTTGTTSTPRGVGPLPPIAPSSSSSSSEDGELLDGGSSSGGVQ